MEKRERQQRLNRFQNLEAQEEKFVLRSGLYYKKQYFLSLIKPRICFSFEFIMKLYIMNKVIK